MLEPNMPFVGPKQSNAQTQVTTQLLFIEYNYDSHTQCPKPCTVVQLSGTPPPKLQLFTDIIKSTC